MQLCSILVTFLIVCSLLYRPPSPSFTHSSRTHVLRRHTTCQQYSHQTRSPPAFCILRTRPHALCSCNPLLLALLVLSGDIESNPGPSNFSVCTLNIRSVLNPLHSAALSDLSDSHQPHLFCLTETWIKPTSSPTELVHCTPPNYSLLSFPRPSTTASGGGTGFLIREPLTQLPTVHAHFSSFESSSVTLKLHHCKLSIFNIYRPPASSTFAKPFSVFLEEFSSFLSIAATTPHEFLITGDFNIHIDNTNDPLTSQFLSILSAFNFTQHVTFPTHDHNHILDLIITSSDTSLAPSLSMTHCSPSDHFPIFTKLSVVPTPLPPPTLHSFRRIHSIDVHSFLADLRLSQLVTNPPESLLLAYNSTLSSLLDKYAPVITKLSRRQSQSHPWFTSALRSFRSSVRHAENIRKRSHSSPDWLSFKFLCNQYHHMILVSKKNSTILTILT